MDEYVPFEGTIDKAATDEDLRPNQLDLTEYMAQFKPSGFGPGDVAVQTTIKQKYAGLREMALEEMRWRMVETRYTGETSVQIADHYAEVITIFNGEEKEALDKLAQQVRALDKVREGTVWPYEYLGATALLSYVNELPWQGAE